MAEHKVPQDVEAEDKLLGPFSFRQFIYLVIACCCIAAAWGLFQLFPLLVVFPIPLAILFLILALPLKKDQPMETYLAAVINFYLKPRKRFWTAGQRESTIQITAPKQTEKVRTRDITEEEASHRLSFLADLIDTEGRSIKNNSSVRDEYLAEANSVSDMLDINKSSPINQMIINNQTTKHANVVSEMRSAIDNQALIQTQNASIQNHKTNLSTIAPNPDTSRTNFVNLANNPAYSIQTIQNQANRIQNQNNGANL